MNAVANELVLERTLDAPAQALWRCWTEPELMKQWFTPKPWETVEVEQDLRAGGGSYVLMRGPDGTEMPNHGVYLEIVPGKRLVFTDAYKAGWVPTEKPFFTAIVEFEDLGNGRTRYTARARHWRAEDAATHEAMGFHQGWGAAADQLEALARTL